jgi:acyl-CoA synthetase (NDP forming)
MPALSEVDSKALPASHGAAFPGERQATDADGAVVAASELGHPVVLKLGGDAIAHKTERGLVRLGLGDDAAVRELHGDTELAAGVGR